MAHGCTMQHMYAVLVWKAPKGPGQRITFAGAVTDASMQQQNERKKKGGFNKAHLPCALHPLTTSLYDTKPAL